MLPVAIAIASIGVIAFLISRQSAIEVELAASELETARAGYVAQAGLQHALRHHAQQGCGPYTDLTAYPFATDSYDTRLTHDLGGTAAYAVDVNQDTWVRDNHPTANHGSEVNFNIRYEGGVIERALVRYDLSSIPAEAAILSATARFYVYKDHPQGPVDIHRITADWAEADATWDSMGANFDSAVLTSIPAQPVAGKWIAVNLTNQVQAWVNGDPNYGIMLASTSEGLQAQYQSRESTNPPYLEVIVGTPATSPAKLGSTGHTDGGADQLIKRNVTLHQNPVSYREIRLGPGAGKDVMLDSFYNSRNHGDHSLDLDNLGTLEHTLIQFRLGAIPHGARILSASLSLYHTVTAGTPTNMGADVLRVTREWVEGTQSGSGTADGATWDTWDGTGNWTQAGGDFDVQPVTSGPITAAVNDWESWEIGSLVQAWVDAGVPNYGVLLKGTGDTEVSFASKEDADPSLRPRLSIAYTCACGEVCAAPQGSGNILMVVINPTTLVAEDRQAKDLFESWGYTVNVIGESANQSAFDSDFADNDVVFISETVNAMQVGAKTASAPIGVVSQDGDYNPDLGLAAGSAHPVGDSINISDNSHYITWPFAAGALDIYTHAMEQLTSSSSLNADQQQLADVGGAASLVALEKSAAMEGGGSAAGRRVMLPLGTRYRFDWNRLNANGRLLVQRALAWGAGADKTSAGDVLLVVPNPAALGAADAARQALIESWDFSVTLIDDSDTQAAFDAAAGASDVVYVSAMADIVALAAKLDVVPTGVVFEPSELSQNFGLADISNKGSNTNQISIVDNTHYITEPFALGAITISDTALKPTVLLGTLAPGMSTLANNSGQTSMSALDIGAARYDAAPSPGRRAMLPWGEAVFDPAWLTADGESLMRRAIEWAAIFTPPPVQQLLFVVPSPGSLGPADSAKQALFESWGYTVNQIDDDAPLADYQAAIGANSVAYVAATAVADSVGSKLFNANIGVVNANTGLHDDFGFSTVRFVGSTNAPLNTLASHYITQAFGGGQVTLYTSDQISGGAAGTLAADLDQIGSWSSGALAPLGGLVTLDAGAMTSIGEAASGRRAQMPWDSLDVGTLSADGLTILQRSLEWAEGANIDLSPVAHWKLDETSGPTAVDSAGSNDGTWTNDPIPAPGAIDGGLDFDGGDDYVDAGSFDVSGSGITLMAWFNAEAIATDDGRFISKSSGPNEADAYWQLSTTDSGSNRYLRMRIKAGGTTTTLADSSVNLSTGQWYLATATYDNASGEMKLYLDGVEVASRVHVVGGALDTNPSVPVALGANGTAERFFNGVLDDVRIYDRALGATEISDLYAAGAPPAPGYTETYQPWTAATPNNWETVSLASYGVPANAVVEVAVINEATSAQRWGGARALGSSVDRRIQLHEAEAGGIDMVTMHAQADASSQIQHYSENTGQISFILLGYWTGASYTDALEPFIASSQGVWVEEGVGAYGVGPNQVAEILIQNIDVGNERLAGVRASGATYQRRFALHEAEGGGVDALSLMVTADASSIIEVYAQDIADVEFYVLGTWDAPPGTYTGTGGAHGQVSAPTNWETIDLSGFGVPADSIAQFVLANENDGTENSMHVREVGSTIDNRGLLLHEAEAGGADLGSLHVNVDASQQVQWAAQQGATGGLFYPVGWWLLSP